MTFWGRKSQFSSRCSPWKGNCALACVLHRGVYGQHKVECAVLKRWELGGVSGGCWGEFDQNIIYEILKISIKI